MRILVLTSFLLSGWCYGIGFGHSKKTPELKYEGSGEWSSDDGESGTWTSTTVFKTLSKKDEAVKIEISDSLTLKKDGEILSEESHTYVWDFKDTGHPNVYNIFEKSEKIGMGACQEGRGCTSLIEVDDTKMAENLYPNPETKLLEVNGMWKKGEVTGKWTGTMKPVSK